MGTGLLINENCAPDFSVSGRERGGNYLCVSLQVGREVRCGWDAWGSSLPPERRRSFHRECLTKV